jgi:hypothetical protein
MIIFTALGKKREHWKSSLEFYIKNVELLMNENPDVSYVLEASYIKGSILPEDLKVLSKYGVNVVEVSIPASLQEFSDHPSVQHAVQLNEFLRRAKKAKNYNNLLILDPDFYVYGKNWLTKIYQIAERDSLDILGVPYHEYFGYSGCYPTTFFMLLNRLDENYAKLDFLPDLNILKQIKKEDGSLKPENKISEFTKQRNRKIIWLIINQIELFSYRPRIKKALSLFLSKYMILTEFLIEVVFNNTNYRTRRKLIQRDTGYKIRKQIHSLKLKSAMFPQIELPKFKNQGVEYFHYWKSYQDIFENQVDAAEHFWKFGILENRTIWQKNYLWIYRFSCILHKYLEPKKRITIHKKMNQSDFKALYAKNSFLASVTAFYVLDKDIFGMHIGSSKQKIFSNDLVELKDISKEIDILTKFV